MPPAEEEKKDEVEEEKVEETEGKLEEKTEKKSEEKSSEDEELLIFDKEKGTLKTEREVTVEEKERAKEEEKLKNIARENSLESQKEGIPTEEEHRMNMDKFVGFYTKDEVERDKREIERLEKKFKEEPGVNAEDLEIGEKRELLADAILHKFLKKDFIVARTSRYDDLKNHIDHLIIDRKTGETICAFDEGGPTKEALDVNMEGGAKIKYGLNSTKGKVSRARLEKIPIFSLALGRESIKEAAKELNPDPNRISEMEKKLFEFYLDQIKKQIKEYGKERNIPQDVQVKIRRSGLILEIWMEDEYNDRLKELSPSHRSIPIKPPKRRGIAIEEG